MFYHHSEVKNAVDKGFIVKWKNDLYTVIKDSIGQYLISFNGKDFVGYHEPSYDPKSFYIVGEYKNA